MIAQFVTAFNAKREALRQGFKDTPPNDYEDIVKRVITAIAPDENEFGDLEEPDPDRIHRIDDGDYQGTLLFVVAQKGYQPSIYYAVLVSYGSCSGCDTFEGIRSYGDTCTDEQAGEYLTLALHIVQGLKKIGED